MSPEAYESEIGPAGLRPSEIKSVTLADLQFDPPSPYKKLASLAKAGLMLWGALTFGVSIGTAAFYFAAPADEAAVASEAAAPLDDAGAEDSDGVARADIPPHLDDFVAPESRDAPIEQARLPRPRPDEPLYTGSVDHTGNAPRPVYRRAAFGPCEALNQLGASLAFHVRCERQAYYAPPPRHYYAPQPYHPPRVVR